MRPAGAAADRDNLSGPPYRTLTNPAAGASLATARGAETFLSTRCYISGMSVRSGLRKFKPGAAAPIRNLGRAFVVIALIGAMGVML